MSSIGLILRGRLVRLVHQERPHQTQAGPGVRGRGPRRGPRHDGHLVAGNHHRGDAGRSRAPPSPRGSGAHDAGGPRGRGGHRRGAGGLLHPLHRDALRHHRAAHGSARPRRPRQPRPVHRLQRLRRAHHPGHADVPRRRRSSATRCMPPRRDSGSSSTGASVPARPPSSSAGGSSGRSSTPWRGPWPAWPRATSRRGWMAR